MLARDIVTRIRCRLLSSVGFVAVFLMAALMLSPGTALAAEEEEPVEPEPPVVIDHIERPFDDDTWTEGLVDLRSLDLSRTRLTGQGFAGGSLGVTIPTGGFRGLGPLDRLGVFDDATTAPKQVWFRYHIRLLDWNAASTGKLPGLAGLYSSSARGCIPASDTSPGWSARGMFGPPGTNGADPGEVPIGTYLYHADQEGDCGDGLWWNAGLEQGRWHCVEGMVAMNTPGQNDGLLRGWLDGDLQLRRSNIAYLRSGEGDMGVRHMWHNVYFGGSWSTPNPLSLLYDEVVVSTTGRVGCLEAFTDLGPTIHAHSITEMHALGYLYGCDYRLACPLREMSRGEGAALISRILELPAATKDHFSDDTGSTYEEVINRLADARITHGCAPATFCPDRTMTRGEFAAMLVSALHLTGDGADAFNDDQGHFAESSINLLAAEGITSGCGSDRFCPDRTLTRDEAIALFHRSLRYLVPRSFETQAVPEEFPPEGEPPPIPVEERD